MIHNPVDAGIVANGVVAGGNENDLEILVRSVLVNPVRVQYAQVATDTANTLFGDRTQVAFCFEHNTLVLRLTVNNTLSVGTLASTTAHSNAEDDIPLFGLVSEATGLVWTRGPCYTTDFRKLAVLPSTHAQQETQHVALLPLIKLLEVFVSSHVMNSAF